MFSPHLRTFSRHHTTIARSRTRPQPLSRSHNHCPFAIASPQPLSRSHTVTCDYCCHGTTTVTSRFARPRCFHKEDTHKEPVTVDEVNNLAVQLKTLQVQVGTLGGEYHAANLSVSDAYDNLWSIYRKNKNKEISKKQKATNQTSIKAFFSK